MSAEASKTPSSLFKTFQAALATPRRLLNRVAGGAGSPAPAAASGDAASEDAEKPPEQTSAPTQSKSTPQQQPRVLQVTQATNRARDGTLQQTLLQQTTDWGTDKHAALERFFSRAQPTANSSQLGTDHSRGQANAVLDILNTKPSAYAREGSGPVRRGGSAARYAPYSRPSAAPSRTGAGHVNSADALYSNAGRTRPLTPMPALKPPGTGPLSAFLQQPDSAAVADGAPQPTAAGDAAAGRCQNIGSQVGTSTAAAAATAAAMPAGSLFGAAGGAAAAPGPSTAGLFPGNVNIRQSAAAFTARPASRSGFFGSSSAGVGAAPSTWAGLGSSGSMQSIPSLLGAPVPAAPKPVLGLPKAKSNRAPLMGSKRGAAGGVGPRGLAAAGAGAAAGSLKPMRNTPLKIGLPALGSKRASDLQGPSVLDTGVIGHKRIRLGGSPGLRAMSGLGTSPDSAGGNEARGNHSSRLGAMEDDGQMGLQELDRMPIVQATSVAETILDTMRSLEKGVSTFRNRQQQQQQPQTPAALAPPPLDRLDGGALRTQLFATPNFKQQQQQQRLDIPEGGVNDGALGTTPWARDTGSLAAAPGPILANKPPTSFFTPPAAAAAEAPKLPHISPITPWSAARSIAAAAAAGDGAVQPSLSTSMAQTQNGKIVYKFQPSTADNDIQKAIANVTSAVSKDATDRVYVPRYEFSTPAPIVFATPKVTADKQQRQAQHDQQLQPDRQEVFISGNPLLASTWGSKLQQQVVAAPDSTWGMKSHQQQQQATARPEFTWGSKQQQPVATHELEGGSKQQQQQQAAATPGFKWASSNTAATPAADKAFGTPAPWPKWGSTAAAGSGKAAASPVSPVFAFDAAAAGATVGDPHGAAALPPGCDPELLAGQVKQAAEIPLPPDSEDDDDEPPHRQQQQRQQKSVAFSSATKNDSNNKYDQQQRGGAGAAVRSAVTAAPKLADGVAAQQRAAAVPSQQQQQALAGSKDKKMNRFSVLDALQESDAEEDLADSTAVADADVPQQNGGLQQWQQQHKENLQQQHKDSLAQQQHIGVQQQQAVDEPADRKRKKRIALSDFAAEEAPANGTPVTLKPAIEQFQQPAIPFGSPFGGLVPAAAVDNTEKPPTADEPSATAFGQFGGSSGGWGGLAQPNSAQGFAGFGTPISGNASSAAAAASGGAAAGGAASSSAAAAPVSGSSHGGTQIFALDSETPQNNKDTVIFGAGDAAPPSGGLGTGFLFGANTTAPVSFGKDTPTNVFNAKDTRHNPAAEEAADAPAAAAGTGSLPTVQQLRPSATAAAALAAAAAPVSFSLAPSDKPAAGYGAASTSTAPSAVDATAPSSKPAGFGFTFEAPPAPAAAAAQPAGAAAIPSTFTFGAAPATGFGFGSTTKDLSATGTNATAVPSTAAATAGPAATAIPVFHFGGPAAGSNPAAAAAVHGPSSGPGSAPATGAFGAISSSTAPGISADHVAAGSRGFGFGAPSSSTAAETATSTLPLVPAASSAPPAAPDHSSSSRPVTTFGAIPPPATAAAGGGSSMPAFSLGSSSRSSEAAAGTAATHFTFGGGGGGAFGAAPAASSSAAAAAPSFAFGAQPTSSSAAAAAAGSSPAFGAFGSSAFGSSAPASSAAATNTAPFMFGVQPSSTAAAAPAAASAGGGNSGFGAASGGFAPPAAAAAGPFGVPGPAGSGGLSPANSLGAPTFGAPAAAAAAAATPALTFGAASTPAFGAPAAAGSSSGFGAPAGGGPFGASAAAAAPPPFGGSAASFGQGSGPNFGALQQPSSAPFGQPQQQQQQPAAAPFAFGQPQQPPVAFGQSATRAAPFSFGAQQPQQQQQQQQQPFGAPAQQQQQQPAFGGFGAASAAPGSGFSAAADGGFTMGSNQPGGRRHVKAKRRGK